ncbi:LacI family DNA-binding transcriptional regulator [Stackebrandtia nassauensis]|uniref:Transcriptional regulator, LacI family n=1 Tax=Stackebrandtia nassauensis (strain DSM 44728 / CIP 108903 / NRRL B-16338 / NBRC 102104 / LLR-40K-21) TaxID=446470 RepID=D3Q985_STANL|nr:LacI family DNA-binding transcriptional regulator [Stackebrandtia nassauensis]ADD42567.1 transcriptional regulator, LacI family [Stackebrandtia nassauensis DSM 44728]
MTTASPAGKRPAVMTDVARLAGVSHQTVSRVLHDSSQVRPETRERVLRAIEELDYRPNAMARGLVSRRSTMIGVITFDTILFGPASTLLGIERAARAKGYGVSIATLEKLDRSSVVEAANTLANQGVSGIVIIAPQTAVSSALHSMPRNLTAVAVECGPDSGLPAVSVDQVGGAAQATAHLLELGHKTVWHVSGPGDWLEARDRIEGWRSILERHGAVEPPVITGDWSARSGYAAGAMLAAQPDVTAVFAANDQMALGMLRAFYEKGLRVPDDVSVVGFDDIPEAPFLSPPLTTIRQDFDEMGRTAIATLLAILDGDSDPRPEPIASTLVVRESTGAPKR